MPKCECGEEFENQVVFDEHQKTTCNKRRILCELCNENVFYCDMGTHLLQCGNKTNKCPSCLKYIRRAIYNYHLENKCQNLNDLLTPDSDQIINPYEFTNRSNNQLSQSFVNEIETNKISNIPDVVLKLEKKASIVRDSLKKDFYSTEIEVVQERLQFNILVTGSPRVGKSQLISVLCNGEDLPQTSSSLNSCTKETKCYILKDNQQKTPGIQPFQVNIYDTPGIESWINQNGEETMLKFIDDVNPICLIFCASPGAFADLKQLQPILKRCKEKQIFCALVCTNMWSGSQRKTVIEEFQQQLAFFGDRVIKSFEQNDNRKAHEVIVFGDGALCTMVNSKEYYDPDLSEKKMPVQGIDELIHCIMESLDEEKLIGWCYTVLHRRSFWEKMTQKMNGFYSESIPVLSNVRPDYIAVDFVTQLLNKFHEKNK